MKINKNIVTNSMKEVIRIADGKTLLLEYVKSKYPTNYNFINVEASNLFRNKRVTASMISYSLWFNHYSIRESLINNNLKGGEYPRYSEPETGDYMIKCSKIKDLRREFIVETAKVLFKKKSECVNSNGIFDMLEDIIVYLENGTTNTITVG